MTDIDVSTFRLNPDSVVFRTDGVWRAKEVSRFVSSVEGIYEAFLAVHLAKQSRPSPDEMVARSFQQNLSYYTLLLEEYERVRGRIPESEGLMLPPTIGPGAELLTSLAGQESRYLAFVYDNIRTLAPESHLAVGKVRMGSEGFFTLQVLVDGLGEPIRQMREFIKDLWYRNEQEKALGQLEIARQHLDLRRDYADMLSGPAGKIPVAALAEANVLKQLESEGKLVDVADNLDPETFNHDTDEG